MARATDHDHAGSAAHDPAAVVARAESVCAQRGLSFTPMRRRVLEALAGSTTPLSAYELADRLKGEKRVAPVQVYRALEFLLSAGVIHRLATKSAYIACEHQHAPGETVVFLVCAECGLVEEATSKSVETGLKGAAAASGFRPRHPVVEVEGQCAACQRP